MAAVRLPALQKYPATPSAAQDLRGALRHEHHIEVRTSSSSLIPIHAAARGVEKGATDNLLHHCSDWSPQL
jgi:hypothetical protein